MINWGKTIKKYRVKLNMTQVELSSRVHITPTYVSALEHNRKEPSMTLIHDISRAFGVPQEVLYWDAITFPTHMPAANKEAVRLAKALTRTVYAQLTPQ